MSDKNKNNNAQGGPVKAPPIAESRRRKRDDSVPHCEVGENSMSIHHMRQLAALPLVDMHDLAAVQNRIDEYFHICEVNDMRPSFSELALAFGMTRKSLYEYREGILGSKTAGVGDALKKASQMLDSLMNYYMQNGKINPVSGIFIMKNNFGYADKQEIVVKPEQPLGAITDASELEQRYLADVVGKGAAQLTEGTEPIERH